MASITFDTLAYTNKLKEAGIPAKHAEAQAEAQKELLAEVLDSTLATKTDIKELELRLSIRFGAMLTVAVTVIAVLDKLL